MNPNTCHHVDGEFCERCLTNQIKDKMNNNLVTIQVIIARIGDRIDVTLQGESSELNDFGIDAIIFQDLGVKIDKAVQAIIK